MIASMSRRSRRRLALLLLTALTAAMIYLAVTIAAAFAETRESLKSKQLRAQQQENLVGISLPELRIGNARNQLIEIDDGTVATALGRHLAKLASHYGLTVATSLEGDDTTAGVRVAVKGSPEQLGHWLAEVESSKPLVRFELWTIEVDREFAGNLSFTGTARAAEGF